MSGRWRVEECGGGGEEEGEGEGRRVRRLVFVKTSHLVQTEMRLRPGTTLIFHTYILALSIFGYRPNANLFAVKTASESTSVRYPLLLYKCSMI